jgi:hypothetical protein
MTVQPWRLTGPRDKSDAGSKHPRRLVRRIGRHSDRAQPALSVVDNPSLPTIRVRARENNVRKGTGRCCRPAGRRRPQGAFLWPNREQPSSSCRGRRAPSGHQMRHAPMSRVNLDQRKTHAVGHGCARTSGRGPGSAKRMPVTLSGPTTRRVAGQRVVRPGADLARRRAAAAHLEVANEGECVRLLPGLRRRAPTAVHHRGLDGSTMETTTPP